MDPISIGLVGFGFYKLIQFITKEDEFAQEENEDSHRDDSPVVYEQSSSKEIPYNH
jgi:hypothetical protein